MRFEVVATLPDDDAVRSAIEQLSLHGVDGHRMQLDDGQSDTASREWHRRTDRRVLNRIGRRVLRCGLSGLLVGVGGALAVTIIAPLTVLRGLMLIAAVAASTTAVGLLLGANTIPTMAPAWGEANAGRRHPRRLRVTGVPRQQVDEVQRVLRTHGGEPSAREQATQNR